MKQTILRKRIEKAVRLALVTVLSLTMIFESFALVDATEADAITYCGYTWHRMYCERDMDEFYIEGKTKTNQRQYLGQVKGGGPADNDQNNWFRVLFVYSDDHYFLSGTGMCNDGESYAGAYIKGTYGMKVSQDEFSTMSGLGAPWIKKSGTDSRNDNDNMYYIRTSSNEGLGSQIACFNMNHYGVRHHAAIYSENRWIGAGSTSGWEHRHCFKSGDRREYKCSCSCCVHIDHTFRWNRSAKESFYDLIKQQKLTLKQARSLCAAYEWKADSPNGKQVYTGNGGHLYAWLTIDSPKRIAGVKKTCTDTNYYDNSIFDTQGFALSTYKSNLEHYDNGKTNTFDEATEIFIDVQGVCDRCWYWPDNDYEIGTTKYEYGRNRGFKIFIGEPRPVATISITQALAPGSMTVYKDLAIKEGTRLVVPKNATLVIQGTCFNNGNIYVDGGTLIVQGVLDTNQNLSIKTTTLSGEIARICGVEEGTRADIYPGSLYMYNGATLIIEDEGVLISSRYSGSTTALYSNSHATIKGSLATRTLILEDSSLRGRNGSVLLLAFDPGILNVGETYGKTYFRNHNNEYLSGFGSNTNGGVYVKNSSIQQNGMLYIHTNVGWSWTNGFAHDFIQNYNIEATIGSMMRNW